MKVSNVMLRHIKITAKVVVSGIISLCILSGFVFFYFNHGVHITNASGATDYKWEPNQVKNTMTEGHAFLKMDCNGFNNENGNTGDVDILLIGSSQMEAFNVPQGNNTASVLNSELSMFTYNIGISGHTIYHCIRNLDSAVTEYKPQHFVVLVTDDIWLDPYMMQQVMEGNFDKIPSYDSGMLYTIQKRFPVIKTLYKKITEWKDAEIVQNTSQKSIIDDHYLETLSGFLTIAESVCNENNVSLIIVYQPRTKLNRFGQYLSDTDSEAISVFKNICSAKNITFLDMTESFESLYNEQHILAHGFANTAVGYGHLNKYGHAIIAEELAKVIQGVEE